MRSSDSFIRPQFRLIVAERLITTTSHTFRPSIATKNLMKNFTGTGRTVLLYVGPANTRLGRRLDRGIGRETTSSDVGKTMPLRNDMHGNSRKRRNQVSIISTASLFVPGRESARVKVIHPFHRLKNSGGYSDVGPRQFMIGYSWFDNEICFWRWLVA